MFFLANNKKIIFILLLYISLYYIVFLYRFVLHCQIFPRGKYKLVCSSFAYGSVWKQHHVICWQNNNKQTELCWADFPGSAVCTQTAGGIKGPLCCTFSFTVLPSIDLFLCLLLNPSSMSNPLWCSHVCWSLARVAWDYSRQAGRHTHYTQHTHTLLPLRCGVPQECARGCPSTLTCRGPLSAALEANLLCGTGSRETFPPPSLPSYGFYQGKMK